MTATLNGDMTRVLALLRQFETLSSRLTVEECSQLCYSLSILRQAPAERDLRRPRRADAENLFTVIGAEVVSLWLDGHLETRS